MMRKQASFQRLLASVLFVVVGLGVTAQVPMQQQQQQTQETPNYSDEELLAFVNTTQDIMELQESYQAKMVEAIEENGLTTEEFQSMSQQQQQPGAEAEQEAAGEKLKAFDQAMQAVMGIQQEMNQEMQSTIQENDMEVQEYQQMSSQIQQNPELSQKVNEMMQGQE